jgi:hypothetical protein
MITIYGGDVIDDDDDDDDDADDEEYLPFPAPGPSRFFLPNQYYNLLDRTLYFL